ncbi:hypothetical protein [Marivirga sp.]|uniref:hypothetical protein n=1 Tax=Marivirga sp. TaxID=2018662 RepID=UPI0025D59EE9|nr:hypothetical protein [Marivirga sp.]
MILADILKDSNYKLTQFSQDQIHKLEKATCSCKLAILRPKSIKPELLAIYLKSKFGQNQIQKFRRGTGQTGLILEDFDQILIPSFSSEFSNKITELINSSYTSHEASINNYKKAEKYLLKELDLDNFQLSQEPVNIKSFSDSFGNSGRLDAEYYQVKYEQVIERIKSKKHDKLINLVNITKSIEPGSANYAEQGFPFIRVSDFDKLGVSTPDKYLTSDFCDANNELINSLKPKKRLFYFQKMAVLALP